MKISKYLKKLSSQPFNKQYNAIKSFQSIGFKIACFSAMKNENNEDLFDNDTILLGHKELPVFVLIGPQEFCKRSNISMVEIHQIKEPNMKSLISCRRWEDYFDTLKLKFIEKKLNENYNHYLSVKNGVVINNLHWFKENEQTISSWSSTTEIVRSKPQAISDYAALLKYEKRILKQIEKAKADMLPIVKEII